MAKDYSSIYAIKDFLNKEVAPKYFDVEDLAMLNTGWYGYTTEIGSTIMEDNMRTTSRYITELIPGQSRLSDFIYAQAANYGISDVFATCASCEALLFIKESDVLENGTVNGKYIDYIIDADMVVYIEDIPFSIPSDIKIRAYLYNGVYKYRCTYTNNILNSVVQDTSNTYIKSAKTKISDPSVESTASYIAMHVTLYQYIRKRETKFLLMNSKLNIPYVDIEFEDSLCNFEVLYTPANSTKAIQLKKLLATSPPIYNGFCYYKLDGENVLRLSFSNDDRYFVPEYNSQLEIITYECVGKKGEFTKYTGDNIYVCPSTQRTDIDYNNKVALYCNVVTDSIGAKDAYTLEEIRTLTAEKQITVDSITTDNDLDKYFTTYTTLYNTFAKFIKIRNDLASRIYSSYSRLRDDNIVYPTNTINLGIQLTQLSTTYDHRKNNMTIKAGSRIGYRGDSVTECIVLPDSEPKQDIEYTLFGLLSIEKEPMSVQLYMNSVDETIPMSYAYVNDNALYQFIIKSFNVKRNAIIGENDYQITVAIIPNDITILNGAVNSSDEDYIEEDTDEVSLDIAKIHVYLYFEESLGHYIKLEYDPEESLADSYIFKASIGSTDIVAGEDIELTGMTYVQTHEVQDCSINMVNPKLQIIVAYEEEDAPGHDYVEIIPAIKDFTLCDVYEPYNDSFYFAYPMTLVRPTLEFVPESNEYGYSIYLTDLPVIGRDFAMKDNNLNDILTRINSQHVFLQNAMITSNYAIYMKFFNTYGRSKTFTITNGEFLNRVNCNIDLGICFVDGVEYSEYLDSIKLTIKEYIEKANKISENEGVNAIKFSELMHELHTTYANIINYVVIYSINGYDGNVQTITMNLDLSSDQNMYIIPEFLTINVEDIKITIL